MSENTQNRDYQWFLKNYLTLFSKYGIAFLAIKNEAVLGTYSSYAEGVNTTSKSQEIGTFIIQKCNGDETAYTNYISSTNVCIQ